MKKSEASVMKMSLDKKQHCTTSQTFEMSKQDISSAIIISLLSMLLYVNTLNHQFVYDDRYLVCH